MVTDAQGHLWVATYDGIGILDESMAFVDPSGDDSLEPCRSLRCSPSLFCPAATGGAALSIHYDLAEPGRIDLHVLDAAGRLVRRLPSGWRPTGTHFTSWDGRDAPGRDVAAGAYFIRLGLLGDWRTERVIVVR